MDTQVVSHADRCRAECTRDVIFLFQVRELQLLEVPFSEDEEDFDFTDGILDRVKDADGNDLEEPQSVNLEDWLKLEFCTSFGDVPCVQENWRTESVWLDRGEAESWAKAHQYRWKHGWRVYGVPAEGELAKRLRGQG